MPEGIFYPGRSRVCWRPWVSTRTNCNSISSTVPRHPGPLHHPGPEAEVEAGDAAGCHPEGVAGTTMEARPGVGVAVAVEEQGDIVAVGVGVAAALPLDERA